MISKQEQQVVDILTDKVEDMIICETYQERDHGEITTVAEEITAIFQSTYKDTRSKRERALDEQFAAMGVKPRVYHFTKDMKTFRGVTIATNVHEWVVINSALICYTHPYLDHPATALREGLQREGIYGIAICDKRDPYNKRTGRMKAKGRLMQHLLREAQKE